VGGEGFGAGAWLDRESGGWRLCDREDDGGGPGGGGGSGMPGSHFAWDKGRGRADVGVSMTPTDAARRAPGGPELEAPEPDLWISSGIWIARRLGRAGDGASGCCSGGLWFRCSWSFRRPRDGKPNLLSLDAPRPAADGGGGKLVFAGGSGEGRCMAGFDGGIRGADVFADTGSNDWLTGRPPLGGLYGGGGSGAAAAQASVAIPTPEHAHKARAPNKRTVGIMKRMGPFGSSNRRSYPFLRIVGLDGARWRVNGKLDVGRQRHC
jgi:hypothetical protein